MRSRSIALLAACLIVQALGCGGGAPPPPKEDLVSVRGSVRVAGQPTAGIKILFTPTGGTGGNGGFAVTDDSGNYELIHSRTNQPGVAAGEYVVTFSRFLTPDGAPLPANVSPFAGGARESLPPKWSDPTKKGMHNTVTVKGDDKPLDFAIPKS